MNEPFPFSMEYMVRQFQRNVAKATEEQIPKGCTQCGSPLIAAHEELGLIPREGVGFHTENVFDEATKRMVAKIAVLCPDHAQWTFLNPSGQLFVGR